MVSSSAAALASLVIAEHGDGAFDRAVDRAREELARGDEAAARIWVRIAAAIADARRSDEGRLLH